MYETMNQIPESLPFYGLLNDYLFHVVMQENKKILTNLVAALLKIPIDTINDVRVMNPIIRGEAIDRKTAVMDLLLLLNDNTRMNIELQNYFDPDWKPRSLFYLTKAFSDLKAGEKYSKLQKTYQISIINVDIFPEEKEFFSIYHLKNINTGHEYSDLLDLRLLNLTKMEYAREEDQELVYWAKAFLAKSEDELLSLSKEKDLFWEVTKMIRSLTEDEKIRMQIEAAEDWARQERASADRRKEMDEREERLNEFEGNLKELKGNLEELKGNLEELKGNLEKREGNLEKREGNLDKREGNLDKRAKELDARGKKLNELDARESKIKEKENQVSMVESSLKKSILEILSSKGTLSSKLEDRINEESDLQKMNDYLSRALSSNSVKEFEDDIL